MKNKKPVNNKMNKYMLLAALIEEIYNKKVKNTIKTKTTEKEKNQ